MYFNVILKSDTCFLPGFIDCKNTNYLIGDVDGSYLMNKSGTPVVFILECVYKKHRLNLFLALERHVKTEHLFAVVLFVCNVTLKDI